MSYSRLYVNGASHTKLDVNTKLWPEHLAVRLNLDLTNHAQQGKSVETILTQTIMDLDQFDQNDTIVVLHIPTTTVRQCWYKIENKGIQEVSVNVWKMPEPKKFWTTYYTEISNDFDMYAKWFLNVLNVQNFLKANSWRYHIIFDGTEFYKNNKTPAYWDDTDLKIDQFEINDDAVFNKFKQIRNKHLDETHITPGMVKWFEKYCNNIECIDGVHWSTHAHEQFVDRVLISNLDL